MGILNLGLSSTAFLKSCLSRGMYIRFLADRIGVRCFGGGCGFTDSGLGCPKRPEKTAPEEGVHA